MSDTQTDPPPADPGGKSDDYGKAPTMGDLRTMVADVVKDQIGPLLEKLKPGDPAPAAAAAGGGQAGEASPKNLAEMVDAGVKKVLGDRDKETAEAEHRKQHEAIAAAAERPPRQRSKRSRWLGNIYDDD